MESLEASSASKLHWAWVSLCGSLLQAFPEELDKDTEQKESTGQRQQSKACGLLLQRVLCGTRESFICMQAMKHPLRGVSRPTCKTK